MWWPVLKVAFLSRCTFFCFCFVLRLDRHRPGLVPFAWELTKSVMGQELRPIVNGDETGLDSWVLADVRPEVEFGICKLPGFSSESFVCQL
jgi:hypothetical protein